ncbi:MAG: SDR family oxidoreductase [Bacteroidales bacterium]|nr:SDR family oxidoreductase [Bacteroidales bacterium]
METFNPFSLKGKTILITGASSGIGRAMAISCSKMGGTIIISGRNKGRLDETLSLMEGNGHIVLPADLTKETELTNMVSRLPKLDGIIHCAGVGSRVFCKEISIKDFENVMRPNFEAPVLLQSEILRQKKLNKASSIVFIASRAADSPSIGNAMYSASKGAIISYAKCLGLELAIRQIRVNCICPAMVWTNLIIQDGFSKAEMEEAQKKYPLKRYGQPEDIANLAIYLLSDASSWMTGSCVDITGGGEGTLV